MKLTTQTRRTLLRTALATTALVAPCVGGGVRSRKQRPQRQHSARVAQQHRGPLAQPEEELPRGDPQ